MHRSIRTQCNIIISFHVSFLKPIYSSVFLSVLSEGLKKERHCVLISLSSSLVSLFASVLSASICALLFRSSNLYPLFPIYVDCSYQFISRYTTPKWKRGYFRHRLTVLPLAHAVQVYKDPVNQTHFIFFSLSYFCRQKGSVKGKRLMWGSQCLLWRRQCLWPTPPSTPGSVCWSRWLGWCRYHCGWV